MSYNELRHREVLLADFEDIYRIDVTLEGTDYIIAVDGEEDDERIWKYGEGEVEITSLGSEAVVPIVSLCISIWPWRMTTKHESTFGMVA